jgi:8-amino-7-oxononanoate synthase
MRDLKAELQQRRDQGRYRQRRSFERCGSHCHDQARGGGLLSFCSNDYLGLSQHPALAETLAKGARDHGTGSGAAHLVNGHHPAHQALEEELADYVGQPAALLFSTGYMANLGCIQALTGRGDLVVADRLNHASLLDGAQLSGARLRRYPHLDMAGAAQRLAEPGFGERLLVSDAVFSMDGDLAPLPELMQLAQRQGARLLLDDAHGFGVLGPQGQGSLAHWGQPLDADSLYMATLGKALGGFGAFVAGSRTLIETLVNNARTYIFTTALPPALAEANRAGLRLLREEGWRRERLNQHIQYFRARMGQLATSLNLHLLDSSTAIQPLLLGSEARALAWSAALEARGILVTAIRPPTVPPGTARLRITLSAIHELAELDALLEALAAVAAAEQANA